MLTRTTPGTLPRRSAIALSLAERTRLAGRLCALGSLADPARAGDLGTGGVPAPLGRRRARSGARGDPEDPPRDRGHAREPLIRLLLRHLSGRRWDPAAQR